MARTIRANGVREDSKKKSGRKAAKRAASKKVRKSEVSNGGDFKRAFESYKIREVKSY